MQQAQHHSTLSLATLFAAFALTAGNASGAAASDQPQVRLDSWVVLTTADFKHRLEAARNDNQLTSDTEIRALLSQGRLSGDAEILMHPTMLALDGDTAEFETSVELPLEKRTPNGRIVEPESVAFDVKITPQALTSKDFVLTLAFTLLVSQGAGDDSADSITSKRTVRSKILVSNNGPAVLGGLLENSPEQWAPQGQRRELFLVVAPRMQ